MVRRHRRIAGISLDKNARDLLLSAAWSEIAVRDLLLSIQQTFGCDGSLAHILLPEAVCLSIAQVRCGREVGRCPQEILGWSRPSEVGFEW